MIRKISKRRSAAGEVYSIKRSRPKRKPRPASETARIYGPPARRKWMKTLPCSACGIVGYSEGAHVLGNGGMGRKADADTQAPLCRMHFSYSLTATSWYIGCHTLYDEHRSEFDKRFPDFNPEKASADCEVAWKSYAELRGAKP